MQRIDGELYHVERDPKQLNALALAYIGDSIYEVYVRQHLLAQGGVKPHFLHRWATMFVSAKAQAEQLDFIWDKLDEEEQMVVRRGRNAKSGTIPKHASHSDYHKATAFEALIGYLYLLGRTERLHGLIDEAMSQMVLIQKEGKK